MELWKNLFSILNRRRSYKNSYWEIMSLFFFEIQWIRARFTTRPVLERTVRVAEETSNQTIECPVLAQFIDKSCIFNHKVYKSMFISLTHCNTLLEYLKNKKWDLFYQYIEALTLFIENQIISKIGNLQFLSLECRPDCVLLIQNLKAKICVKVNFDLNFYEFSFFLWKIIT